MLHVIITGNVYYMNLNLNLNLNPNVNPELLHQNCICVLFVEDSVSLLNLSVKKILTELL